MQKLLIFTPGLESFDPQTVEHAFRACGQFMDLRLDEPCGALIECEYKEPDSWTIIRLSSDASTISLRYSGDTALRAAILIQKALGIPLRMVDDSYSFDLTFSNLSTLEELESAIEGARTS